MKPMNIENEILNLRKTLEEHNYNYYVMDNPTISDFEYDAMMQRLIKLEEDLAVDMRDYL